MAGCKSSPAIDGAAAAAVASYAAATAAVLASSPSRPRRSGPPVPEVLPLGENGAADRRRTLRAVHARNPHLGTIVLVLSKGDTMGRVWALLEMLVEAQGAAPDDMVLTLDRPEEREPLGF